MNSAIYIGTKKELKNEKAIIMDSKPGYLKAQFNNIKLKEAFGWHEFPITDFRIECLHCGNTGFITTCPKCKHSFQNETIGIISTGGLKIKCANCKHEFDATKCTRCQ